jgi:hypothetical protein
MNGALGWRSRVAHFFAVVTLLGAILFTVGASLFAAGYAFDEPGGLAAVGLVALWVVPLAVLIVLVTTRPGVAWWVLLVCTGVALVVAVWQFLDPGTLRDWEFTGGPVTAIAPFVPLVPIAILRRWRPLSASLMLLVIGIARILADLRTAPFHLGSAQAVAVPLVIAGGLLLLAGLLDPHPRRPAT